MRGVSRLAILLGVVVGVWWLFTSLEHAPLTTPPHPTRSIAPTASPKSAPSGSAIAPPHRFAAPAIDESPRAPRGPSGLTVLVRRLPSERPLPHVVVTAIAQDGRDEFTTRRVVVTGRDGIAEFDGLDPGPWWIEIDRGGKKQVDVRSDTRSELTFDVDAGSTIRVRVFDASERPVPNAEVLYWRASSYFETPLHEAPTLIGWTDADGELLLEGVASLGPSRAWFAARHDVFGHSVARSAVPSGEAHPKRATGEEDVVLLLPLETQRGAFLAVEVLGTDGVPVPRALVSMRPQDAGRRAENVGRLELRHWFHRAATAADGRVSIGPLAKAQYELRVEAGGHATHRAFVEIESLAPLTMQVRLLPAARVAGIVRDEHGAALPAAGIRVWCGDQSETTISGPDGTFELDRLNGGDATWQARLDGCLDAEGSLALRSAARTELSITLKRSQRLHGRLLDAQGNPLSGWTLLATPSAAHEKRSTHRTLSGADGTFEFFGPADVDWALRVVEPGQPLPAPQPSLDTARPREEPWILVLPDDARATAWVEGVVVDAAGRPVVHQKHFSLEREPPARIWFGNTMPNPQIDPATGHFRLGPVPPGNYSLWIAEWRCLDFAVTDVVLRPHATTYLGTITEPESGTLDVEIEFAPGVDEQSAMIHANSKNLATTREIDAESRRASMQLLPGRYEVTIFGGVFRTDDAVIEVRAGETVRHHAVLRPAVRTPLRFCMPDGERSATFFLRDARGRLVLDDEFEGEGAHSDWLPFLDMGPYVLEVHGASGRQYRAAFEVTSLERRTAKIELRPTPQ